MKDASHDYKAKLSKANVTWIRDNLGGVSLNYLLDSLLSRFIEAYSSGESMLKSIDIAANATREELNERT
jgi:hypothetical protein